MFAPLLIVFFIVRANSDCTVPINESPFPEDFCMVGQNVEGIASFRCVDEKVEDQNGFATWIRTFSNNKGKFGSFVSQNCQFQLGLLDGLCATLLEIRQAPNVTNWPASINLLPDCRFMAFTALILENVMVENETSFTSWIAEYVNGGGRIERGITVSDSTFSEESMTEIFKLFNNSYFLTVSISNMNLTDDFFSSPKIQTLFQYSTVFQSFYLDNMLLKTIPRGYKFTISSLLGLRNNLISALYYNDFDGYSSYSSYGTVDLSGNQICYLEVGAFRNFGRIWSSSGKILLDGNPIVAKGGLTLAGLSSNSIITLYLLQNLPPYYWNMNVNCCQELTTCNIAYSSNVPGKDDRDIVYHYNV